MFAVFLEYSLVFFVIKLNLANHAIVFIFNNEMEVRDICVYFIYCDRQQHLCNWGAVEIREGTFSPQTLYHKRYFYIYFTWRSWQFGYFVIEWFQLIKLFEPRFPFDWRANPTLVSSKSLHAPQVTLCDSLKMG